MVAYQDFHLKKSFLIKPQFPLYGFTTEAKMGVGNSMKVKVGSFHHPFKLLRSDLDKKSVMMSCSNPASLRGCEKDNV